MSDDERAAVQARLAMSDEERAAEWAHNVRHPAWLMGTSAESPAETADPMDAPAESSLSEARATIPADTSMESRPVQRLSARAAPSARPVQSVAAAGVQRGGSPLPHLGTIQASFGDHDVGNVEAHVGGDATTAAAQMGAVAYAMGNHVAFAAQPDLHTAAHEAAHVVQQRGGVQLAGGVGQAGDSYERQADAVADLVVQGKSAAALLGGTSSANDSGTAVQRKEGPLSDLMKIVDDHMPNVCVPGDGHDRPPQEPSAKPAKPSAKPVKSKPKPPPYSVHTVNGVRSPAPMRFRAMVPADIPSTEKSAAGLPRSLSAKAATVWPKGTVLAPALMMLPPNGKGKRGQQVLIGPEVDAFYAWIEQQSAAADVIKRMVPSMIELAGTGLLQADYRVANRGRLDQILRAVRRSGDVTAVTPGHESDAASVVSASARVGSSKIELMRDAALLRHYRTLARGLSASVTAARGDVQRFYTRAKLRAAKGQVKQLEAKRDRFLKTLGFMTTLLSGGLAAAGKLAAGKSLEGMAEVMELTGAAGAIGAILGSASSDRLASAKAQVASLRGELQGEERTVLSARLVAVEAQVDAYLTLCRDLSTLAVARRESVSSHVKAFGAEAGVAVKYLRPEAAKVGGARVSMGEVTRLFRADKYLAVIHAGAAGMRWPTLEGVIPLGGYLSQSPIQGAAPLVGYMALEASKLRWWKERIDGVAGVRSQMLAVIKAAGR